ncbi:hypothetical protein BDW74DRAFT_175995 [Aspergillus multicolor]|uniref:uncharacterized protein n=1 Tax=Aspergillus multicolor TaxID=41759 RepID=UPI003CCD92CE
MYFDVFSAHWPFIHRSSFNMNQRNESPLLVQAMLVVGMWMASTDRLRAAAVELHGKLDEAIWEQRDKWDVSVAVTAEDRTSRSRQVPRAAKWPLPVYQAILLHIIFSQLHTADTKSARSSNKSNFSLGLDLKPCATEATIALLSSLVQSCRRLGMFHYPDIIASCRLSLPKLSSNSSSLIPHIWVGIEEVKRFNVALYRICRAISSSSSALSSSNPDILDPSPASRREARWQLSAHELQFPPPTNDRMWNTTTWEEWESAVALDPHVSMNPDHTISMDLVKLATSEVLAFSSSSRIPWDLDARGAG